MVKILGINGKLIITILYVYYWEINAEDYKSFTKHNQYIRNEWRAYKNIKYDGPVTNANMIPQEPEKEKEKGKLETLKVWQPNPEFDLRRAATTKVVTPDYDGGKAIYRAKGTEKFNKEIRAEISHSVPKHIPKHGQPHFEHLANHQNNDDDDPYDKIIDRTNPRKRHGSNKKHHERSLPENPKESNNNDTDDRNKHKKTKNHKGHDSKNSKVGREKGRNEVKKHERDKRVSSEKHDTKVHNEKGNDQNNERHHKFVNRTQTNDHETNAKNKNVVRHGVKHVSVNKNQNHNNKQQNDHDNQNKIRYTKDKDKSHLLRDKGHTPTQATKSVSQWPIHHHHAKLRTHPDALRSTRMTAMYLMQQSPDDPEKGEDKKPEPPPPVDHPVNILSSLTPYAVASQMKVLMQDFPQANVTIEVLDRTVEYNDIVILKMTETKDDSKYFRAEESKYMDEVPEKKIIFIVHALTVMGINSMYPLFNVPDLKLLISYYVAHLKLFDIFLMPMANPDGYSAAFTNTVWNKNMAPQDACPGVMLDRNFDVAWNGSKKLSSCSQMFPGKTPFSETETKAVRDVFHHHGHKILAYIHVHAGTYNEQVFKGDAILYPRGYTEVQSDDDKYIDLKGEIDEAMKNASFQVLSVTVDTLHNWYGKVSGTSVDYAATVYGIPYALEFVMQAYAYEDGADNKLNALTEIWSRLITTSFKNMYKSLRTNEVQKK